MVADAGAAGDRVIAVPLDFKETAAVREVRHRDGGGGTRVRGILAHEEGEEAQAEMQETEEVEAEEERDLIKDPTRQEPGSEPIVRTPCPPLLPHRCARGLTRQIDRCLLFQLQIL